MRIIFTKEGLVFPRSIKNGIKREVEKELTKYLGRHVSSLQEIAVKHPTNPTLNGYAIYTETEEENPQEIFKDTIKWGTNYFFGAIIMQTSHKKFYFLADIQNPLYVGTERILLQGVNKVKVFIKQ
jgi:hypothetical protein